MDDKMLKKNLIKQVKSFHAACIEMKCIEYKDYMFGLLLFGLRFEILNDDEMDFLLEKYHDVLTHDLMDELRNKGRK